MKNLSHRLASGIRHRPRVVWGLGNSAINFAIISAIASMPIGPENALNLGVFYIVFLFWDACFLGINDNAGTAEVRVGLATVLCVATIGLVAYYVIAGTLPGWHLAPVFFLACWSKALHNTSLSKQNYDLQGQRIAIAQVLVLVATISGLAFGLISESGPYFMVATFVFAPLTGLVTGGLPNHVWFASRDFSLLPSIFLDFVKNQIVFILFGRIIGPTELADILFARSALSPIAIGLAMRRKGIEDDLLTRGGKQGYFDTTTVVLYIFLIVVGFATLTIGHLITTYAAIWMFIVLLQDIRAHLLRVAIYQRKISAHTFAFVSVVTVGLFALVSSAIDYFSPWIITIPYALEMIVILLIFVTLRGARLLV